MTIRKRHRLALILAGWLTITANGQAQTPAMTVANPNPLPPGAQPQPPRPRPNFYGGPGFYGPGSFGSFGGPFGGPFGGFGYFPGAYQGFYSNGFSLNGPPVPTYGAIPGTFGGSDQRFYGATVPFGYPFGLGVTLIPRRGEPMAPGVGQPIPDLNMLRPAQPLMRRESVIQTSPPIRLTQPTSATLEIIVPPEAIVTLDGEKTTLTGSLRRFETPALPLEKTYLYTIEAEWKAGDQPIRQTRAIRFQPGDRLRVDFTQPQ